MAFTPRKICPLKLSVPELPQECIGPKCMWFMNRQDCCAIKVIGSIIGNSIRYKQREEE